MLLSSHDASADHPHRLQWACRRGLLELDVIFARFIATQYYTRASEQARKALYDLLQCQDQDLFDWLVKHQSVPEQYQEIINTILNDITLDDTTA